MKVKGQVSAFIILAVIIASVIIVYFSVNEYLGVSSEFRPIIRFIDRCVDQTIEEGLYHIGETGGYFMTSNLSIEGARERVAYYFYEEESYFIEKGVIEEELSEYVETMLFFCLRNFVDYGDYEVKQGEIKVDSNIEDEEVVFEISYPLSIKRGENSYTIEEFDKEVGVRLGIMYKAIEEMMKEQLERKDEICISCLQDIGDKYDLFIDMREVEEDSIIFYFIDMNSEILDEPYVFSFANRYEKEEGGLIYYN